MEIIFVLGEKISQSDSSRKQGVSEGVAVKRICRYIFNDSKSAGLRPDRNDYELNVREEIQKVYTPKTR